MNNSFSELEQLTLTLNHFTSHLHSAPPSRQRMTQLAPRRPDRWLLSGSHPRSVSHWRPPAQYSCPAFSHSDANAMMLLVFAQTHLKLIGLLYDHLQLLMFAQAGAAHLGHLLLLCTHQWLVLIGVTWEHTHTTLQLLPYLQIFRKKIIVLNSTKQNVHHLAKTF